MVLIWDDVLNKTKLKDGKILWQDGDLWAILPDEIDEFNLKIIFMDYKNYNAIELYNEMKKQEEIYVKSSSKEERLKADEKYDEIADLLIQKMIKK